MAAAEITGADGERLLPDSFADKSDLDTARAVAFLLNKAARDVGEPHPVPSCRKPEPPQPQPRVPVGKVNDLPFTKATGPEVEQVGPGPMVSPAHPGNIYIEFTEPLDPELEGKVVIAKFKNARWSALHADTRQPIDPTMGEAYPHIAEAKAAAILATTTEKEQPE